MLWFEGELGGRSFNLSAGHARPFSDVVDAVTRVTGLHVDPNSADVVDGGPDRAATVDSSALKQQFGWKPSRSLEDGIRDILADIRSGTSPCLT
jgi:nucleoside-diphosphate-sugar epimerase